MLIKKILPVLSLLSLLSASLSAQVRFSTITDQDRIGKDDYLQVQFIVENAKSIERITAPAFKDFIIASGPMQQSGMSIINGVQSRYDGMSFILKPRTTGKLIIPGATAIADGKQWQSNQVMVTVTNTPSSGGATQPGLPFVRPLPEERPAITEEYLLKPGESAVDKINKNLFVKLEVSKKNCYVGEPVIAAYKLYTRLRSESRVTRRPSLTGFSVYDMVPPAADNASVEKINGRDFNVHIIRKVQLYPLQEGSFELDPVELDNTVHFIRSQQAAGGKGTMQELLDDYMNGISGGRMEDQQVKLSTEPVFVTARPLPAGGRPASFDGAVGKFSIAAAVDKPLFRADDIATLQVSIKGEGNMTMITAPKINWPAGVESYETTVKENTDNRVAPIKGVKQFSYAFSVKEPGGLSIPPISFSYFDPALKAYKTLHTDSITLTIKEAKSTTGIHPAGLQPAASTPVVDWRAWLWLLPVMAMLAAVIALFSGRRGGGGRAMVKQTTNGMLPVQMEADPLLAAKEAFAGNNGQRFYKETGRAVWNALAAKLNITASHLNKPEVVSMLRQRGLAEPAIKLLESVLLDCEMALYTPVHIESDMRRTLNNAGEFLTALGISAQPVA